MNDNGDDDALSDEEERLICIFGLFMCHWMHRDRSILREMLRWANTEIKDTEDRALLGLAPYLQVVGHEG